MRQVLIFTDEDGNWVAECPSLPGCVSQGETREKTVENIKQAVDAYIEALEMDDLPVPEDKLDALLIAI
jgi:predicted RNase H-like HicB family nuclease